VLDNSVNHLLVTEPNLHLPLINDKREKNHLEASKKILHNRMTGTMLAQVGTREKGEGRMALEGSLVRRNQMIGFQVSTKVNNVSFSSTLCSTARKC
jgi:hypothetical protein